MSTSPSGNFRDDAGHQVFGEAGRGRAVWHDVRWRYGAFTARGGAAAACGTLHGPVEVGVGLLPGGGGCKEMLLRAVDSAATIRPGGRGESVEMLEAMKQTFEAIATAKVSRLPRGGSARAGVSIGIRRYQHESGSARRPTPKRGRWEWYAPGMSRRSRERTSPRRERTFWPCSRWECT